MICDSHFHLKQSLENEEFSQEKTGVYKGISCCHEKNEFLWTENFIVQHQLESVHLSFGLHPQMPSMSDVGFLEELLKQKRICAVGECGFDFYNEEFRKSEKLQEEAFEICLSLALEFSVPIIVHDRKALDRIFLNWKKLKQVKSVLFHGFGFGPVEVESILKKGINAYFSFGKALLNGNKKSIACVKNLPLENLLLETDAPYMTLKNEKFTSRSDIKKVYRKFFELRNVPEEEFMNVENVLESNLNAFVS